MPEPEGASLRPSPTLTSVLVCRGQNCGSTTKHPDVDHDGQFEALTSSVEDDIARVTACTSQCHDSNVVVVCRHDGHRPERLWFARVNDGDTVRTLASWLGAGAPDPVPAQLLGRLFGIDAARHLGR